MEIFTGGTMELVKQGGLTLVAIVLMSVIAMGVALERYLTTRLHRQRLAIATGRILGHLREPNATMARAVNQSLAWHPGQPLFQLLLDPNRQGGPGEVRRAQARVIRLTRRRLWVLATIGATAPFVGLFGTVLGIMEAFRQIAAEHTGGFDVVSAGISEALVTTAGGIFVGVEAVVFFNFLQVLVGELAAEIKEAAEELLETVQASHGDPGSQVG